jgi:hypothetical protein
MSKRTTRTAAEPRLVYRSPEGRIEVWRNGPCDFACYTDGELYAFARRQDEAEHAGAMWLAEQMPATVTYQGFTYTAAELEHEAAVWLAEQAQRLAVYEVA